LASLTFTRNLSETRRNEYLKTWYNVKKYLAIRVVENLLRTLPFLGFLLFKYLFVSALILFIISLLLAVVNLRTSLNITIGDKVDKLALE